MFGFKNPLEGKSKKQYYEAAWEELRSKNILDAADIDELSSLINYRNTVAHKPEELLIDLNHEIAKLIPSQYDYEALSKIRNIKKRLHNAMHKHYPIPVDLHNYYMESIIDVLSKDLEKLRKKIDGQFARRLKLKSDVEKL